MLLRLLAKLLAIVAIPPGPRAAGPWRL